MGEVLSSKMVAAEIGVEPRTLRRFLRDDPTYRNAGSGGRYVFTASNLPMLKKRFARWQAGVDQRRSKRDTSGLVNRAKAAREEPEVIDIPKCTPALRKREREQVERLEARLRECGLHITQMTDRSTWVTVHEGAPEDAEVAS